MQTHLSESLIGTVINQHHLSFAWTELQFIGTQAIHYCFQTQIHCLIDSVDTRNRAEWHQHTDDISLQNSQVSKHPSPQHGILLPLEQSQWTDWSRANELLSPTQSGNPQLKMSCFSPKEDWQSIRTVSVLKQIRIVNSLLLWVFQLKHYHSSLPYQTFLDWTTIYGTSNEQSGTPMGKNTICCSLDTKKRVIDIKPLNTSLLSKTHTS